MRDEQYVPRDVMVYVAAKIYWADKISHYSSLKDDNGYYPGVWAAVAFAEETGILTGVGRPEDITKGEAAILLANADKVYEATEATKNKNSRFFQKMGSKPIFLFFKAKMEIPKKPQKSP